jgi:hypothetical protein
VSESAWAEGSSLGPALEPVLAATCEGMGRRLSPVRWFRSDWQRGGGSTGLATLSGEFGEVEVVVKLPVGPVEHHWTVALGGGAGDEAGPTPRVYAAGTSLGGYDLGWLVMERLAGVPLAAGLNEQGVSDLLRAADGMHHRAAAVVGGVGRTGRAGDAEAWARQPREPDWEKAIGLSREVARRGSIPEAQKWNSTLKDVHRLLPTLTARWAARPINTWCHGDLHGGNAMRRGSGACVLIDLALVHPGHWIEDGLYLERVYWGRPEGLCGVNPVSTLAALRKAAGLHNTEDYALLANTRRVMSAAAAPGLVEREGNTKYLHHAIGVIHKLLTSVR